MARNKGAAPRADTVVEAVRRHADGTDHDRALIVERLAWTPEQRLDANATFLRWYFSIRPEGPLIGDE